MPSASSSDLDQGLNFLKSFVFAFRSPAVFFCSWFVVVVLTAQYSSKFPPGNGADDRTKGDRFQTQKRKGFMAERSVRRGSWQKAVVTEGKKEWFCRYCLETNVCSRAKCWRCTADIPAR